jgi:hypothetical protein
MNATNAPSWVDELRLQWREGALGIKVLLVAVLLVKVFLCLFTGHFDIYRFLVFLQHALAFPGEDPWAYRALNTHSDFPYPPALFHFLKALVSLGEINPLPPHEPPAGHLYSLVKLPILMADVVVAACLARRTSLRWMVLTYWTSSIVIFHQFYSGQFDLLVAAPIVFAFCWQDRSWHRGLSLAKWPVFLSWLLSVVLKPFALLFAPFWVLQQPDWRRRMAAGALILTVFVIFKASEWPHAGSHAYREQMGAGVQFLLLNLKMHRQYWFVAASLFLLAVIWFRRVASPWWPVACVTLAIGAFAFHSAGWMTWAAVTLPVVMHDQGWRRGTCRLFLLWQCAFVLRWVYCPTSPLFDSLSVFTDRFLHMNLGLPMGFVYARQPTILGVDSFLLFGYVFAFASFVLFGALMRRPLERRPPQRSGGQR